MSKKIFSVFAVVFTLLLHFASGLMFVECSLSYSNELLLPGVILSLVSWVATLFLVHDVFIGRREYIFKNDNIIVGRKNKVLCEISKSNIQSPKIIVNSITKKSSFFSFYCNGKRHIVVVDERNEDRFKRFATDVNPKKIENTIQYIFVYLLEIFCV